MRIPGTSYERNPKDVGDTRIFLMLTKERIDDILRLRELNNNLMDNMKEMSFNPINTIREFKLNKLDII